MNPNSETRLCELSPQLDEAWRRLYVQAFPEHEREPEDKLAKLVEAGKMVLHKTFNAEGELLCFTMTSIAPEFALLAYMATDPNKRSGGYGSKHLKRLLDVLKSDNPNYIGLFLEIEATSPSTIYVSDEERKVRKRRLSFYQRIGAKRMCRKARYLTPGRIAGGKEWEGELLCVPFKGSIDGQTLLSVVAEILQRMYCLPADDPLVGRVLDNFTACAPCSDPSSVATEIGKHLDAHDCPPAQLDPRPPAGPHVCVQPMTDPALEPTAGSGAVPHAEFPPQSSGDTKVVENKETDPRQSDCELGHRHQFKLRKS